LLVVDGHIFSENAVSAVIITLLATIVLLIEVALCGVQDPLSTSAATFTSTSQDHSVPVSTNAYWGSSYSRPYPTNTWWINLILSGNNPIQTYPYIVKADTQGFHVCYPSRTVASTYIFETFLDNLIIGAKETIGDRQVVSHDDLSVTVKYASGSSSMSSPIVRGQAYQTVEYTGFTPYLSTIHAITGVNGGGLVSSYTGTKLKLTLNNGQTWIIYTTSSVTWTIATSSITASSTFTGVLRAAYLMSSTQETVYDTYSSTYPVSGTTTFTVSSNVATMQFTFTKKGSSSLLLFMLPHHRDIVTNTNYASPEIRYKSIKGDVLANIGDTWTMKDTLVSDVGFYSRYTIPSGNVASLKTQLASDQNSYPTATDPYFGGKAVARLGRLAVVADELGETTIAAKIRSNMKTYLNKWLGVGTSSSDNTLVYEKSYGGIVSRSSVGSSGNDYGNYYYNDHHFHYGYFIYAAACIIKKDVDWGNTYKAKIMEIVRDIANPSSQDPAFTKYRHKDWYTGHSYAAGLFAFADSRNQESTAEAVNAYYGVYTLGLAYNNADLRDLGRVLLQSEIRSAQKYWQIMSSDSIYDSTFAANKVVGVLWENKVDYATFFGANVEYIHGIQMLPYTPISEDFLRPSWLKESYTVFSAAYTRSSPVASQAWLGILYQAQATFDKTGAAAKIATLTGVDDGNTMTNTLYWLYTRPDSSNAIRNSPFADIDAYTGGESSPDPETSSEIQPEPSSSPSPSDSGSGSDSGGSSSSNSTSCGTCGSYGTVECGTSCISSSKYQCCNGTVVSIDSTCPGTSTSVDTACTNIKCATGYNCCNGACYSPSVYGCYDGMLCAVGTSRCGKACYKPSIYQCCDGVLKTLSASC
jgi:endo-1,3(4)-beta-glucanase